MKTKHYTISYWVDINNSELHLVITEGNKIVCAENIMGDFENEQDVKLYCLEVATSHGYTPALFEDDSIRHGREGGKKSSSNLSKKQRKERAKKAAKKRWSQKKS